MFIPFGCFYLGILGFKLNSIFAHWISDEPWPFFHLYIISFDQNWYHLYATTTGGNDLSNNTQIRVIGLMAPEICTKMLKKLREKLRAKFPATTHGYSVVKIAVWMTLS